MNQKSTQIALGGLSAALCLILMFMTGLVPFATYAIPVLAGALLIPVVIENGTRTAMLVYVSTAALSVFIVPDREAAMMYIVFFGYYPILKEKLERLPSRFLEYPIKFLIFNVTVAGAYAAVIFLFGMPDFFSDFGDFGRYTGLVFILFGNVVFGVYDFALTQYISLYVGWFRPTFLR